VVRIEKMTMQGFKSFANRVTIPFTTGFTVVCGPNGSGKSNVCDALTFVLGTTSARTIRAQKLQGLIFNGGANKKPSDSCEVLLYVDNSDGKIPVDEKEVKILRRISRSGISVYKLNGRTVPKAKVIDLLANANLSPEGHNIIMQGDVTKIIEMGPMERRGIIDDISGIAEFDDKKEKAQREMEKVENRVRENMIIVAEKERLVDRLKREKESTEKYLKLDSELRKAKASLLNKRITEDESRIKELEKSKADEERFNKIDSELNEAEKSLEKKEQDIRRMGDEIIQKSKDYETMKRMDEIKTEIIRRKDRIELNEREISRFHNIAVREILKLGMDGVYGTVSSLVSIPKKYSTALSVAMGRHDSDIIVSTDETAKKCIKLLKEKQIGRARFLPLNSIKGRGKKPCKEMIGYAIDLIKFDEKFSSAIEYVLGSTIVVENIDSVKVSDIRTVTLDGDLIEESGAMLGGYFKEKKFDSGRLSSENQRMREEILKLEKEFGELRSREKEESEEVRKIEETKNKLESSIEGLRKKRKELYEEKIELQGKLSRVNIEKAKIEASLESLKNELKEYNIDRFFNQSVEELQERVRTCTIEINKLGPINMKAIEEYKVLNVEFVQLKEKLDKLLEEKESVMRVVHEVEKKRFDKFMSTLKEITDNFSTIYKDLVNGYGVLRLEEEGNIDSGLIIEASPEGKRVLNLDSMSGGEKTLTSLAFLFAVMQHYAAPFYILDEVDAALDKPNTRKIVDVIKKYSKENQFIVITHNDNTIQEADKVFGVSMEDGVSKVFGIEMPKS